MNDRNVVVSVAAPGKVLLAGGYLVLERPNPGLVLAADSCFYSTVTWLDDEGCNSSSSPSCTLNNDDRHVLLAIEVLSPQFHSCFKYFLISSDATNDSSSVKLISQSPSQKPNTYIETTLHLTLQFILSEDDQFLKINSNKKTLGIKLRADNDFYSQLHYLNEHNIPITPENVKKLPKFLPCPINKDGQCIVNKTGMGSSAALVTSLVAALCHFSGVVDINVRKVIVHNLAQLCHSLAQGKIGSGFDVSAAVFGSHSYIRFDPKVLNPLMDYNHHDGTTVPLLNNVVKSGEWNCIVKDLKFPQGMQLLMADVCGGSESPSMARKVMTWRKINQDKNSLWEKIQKGNQRIASLLDDFRNESKNLQSLLMEHLSQLSSMYAEEWTTAQSKEIGEKLVELRSAFIENRKNLKQLGNEVGVPIEPDSQSELADATMSVPGVIAAGVPGAGGEDALFVIYLDDSSVKEAVGSCWRRLEEASNSKSRKITPLSVKWSSNGLHTVGLLW